MTKRTQPTKGDKEPPSHADKFVWKMGDVHLVPDPRKAKDKPPKKEEKH